MSFQATEFEFRIRFWIISLVFTVGFLLYNLDRVNVSVALSQLVFRGHGGENPAAFDHCITGFFALGTLLVIVGALLRSWAGSYLHSSIIHDAALHGEQLVADGPYRHVRNPLYLGNVFLAMGVGFLASRFGFLVISVGMLLFVYRLILREETTLLQAQGERYRRYVAAVPRLFPSLRARIPAAGARPNWWDGLTGESLMWGGALAMAVFTLTQSLADFWIVFGASIGTYFLQAYLRSRRRRTA
jgi:hypothetical protein